MQSQSLLYGETSGDAFSEGGLGKSLLRIHIAFGAHVDSIQFEWLEGGRILRSIRRGGEGGCQRHSFALEPGEKIIRVEGKSGQCVDQLTFTTSKGNQYGPFGGQGGNSFVLDAPGGVNGFFGHASQLLDAIGFYYDELVDEPKTPAAPARSRSKTPVP
ncbi:MAG: jacalin-like lectin domain protein [Proteobacteria bacterium]|nr:hypothetical protein [Cystobacterineae bacterium]MCL2258467.1 hypothetical protein [Cystobacterineae bacterium]MCL2315193.1 jacalin-like lectin domain protein [Pseudomonadota bacterium]